MCKSDEDLHNWIIIGVNKNSFVEGVQFLTQVKRETINNELTFVENNHYYKLLNTFKSYQIN